MITSEIPTPVGIGAAHSNPSAAPVGMPPEKWPAVKVAEDERPVNHKTRAYVAADVLVDITTHLPPDRRVSMAINSEQAIELTIFGDHDTVAAFAARLGLVDVSVTEVAPFTVSEYKSGGSTQTKWSGTYDGHKVTAVHVQTHKAAQ